MDDEWLLVEELLHCPEKVAEFEASAAARLECAGAVPSPQLPAAVVPAPLLAPTGFRLARGRSSWQGLHWWICWCCTAGPSRAGWRGWFGGCRRAGFSHVVGYASLSLLGAGAVDTRVTWPGWQVAPAGACGPARRPCSPSGWVVGVYFASGPAASIHGKTVMVLRAASDQALPGAGIVDVMRKPFQWKQSNRWQSITTLIMRIWWTDLNESVMATSRLPNQVRLSGPVPIVLTRIVRPGLGPGDGRTRLAGDRHNAI